MKLVRYIDLYPGVKAEHVWIHDGGVEKIASAKRFKITIEIPWPEFDEEVPGVVADEAVKA